MVNLGCIDIHPWHSRTASLERPDYAILDLDPLEVDFEKVVKTAIEAKKVMDELSIEGCCKTSGSKGLHIFIALEAKYSYEVALDFIKLLARLVNNRLPDITSLERTPEKRHNRVYLDCYQNRIGATIAAPYCVRPRTGATVSAPLYWEELKKPFKPSDYTMHNIFKRLKKTGDIWQRILGKGTDIENIIANIGKQPF
jgi:bifunctional non-homologous end joining protein LigD